MTATPRTGWWVAVGGALGALARHAVAGRVAGLTGATLPWGTLAVNLLGSLLLGFLARGPWRATRAEVRAFWTVGVCGGFTTFGTFSFELLGLLHRAEYGPALLYALGSVAACVLGVGLGQRAAEALLQRRPTR